MWIPLLKEHVHIWNKLSQVSGRHERLGVYGKHEEEKTPTPTRLAKAKQLWIMWPPKHPGSRSGTGIGLRNRLLFRRQKRAGNGPLVQACLRGCDCRVIRSLLVKTVPYLGKSGLKVLVLQQTSQGSNLGQVPCLGCVLGLAASWSF